MRIAGAFDAPLPRALTTRFPPGRRPSPFSRCSALRSAFFFISSRKVAAVRRSILSIGVERSAIQAIIAEAQLFRYE